MNLPDINRLQRQFDRLFGDFTSPTASAQWVTCDVEETDKSYLMSFDLPGMKKEDVKINFHDGVLTVSGERKNEREEKAENRYYSERYYGSFERSFTLPAGVKAEEIEADYQNGVLRITVPKAAATKGREIKIGEKKQKAAAA